MVIEYDRRLSGMEREYMRRECAGLVERERGTFEVAEDQWGHLTNRLRLVSRLLSPKEWISSVQRCYVRRHWNPASVADRRLSANAVIVYSRFPVAHKLY